MTSLDVREVSYRYPDGTDAVRCLSLRVAPGASPRTPAMALGLTDHRWTVAELLRRPLPVPGG